MSERPDPYLDQLIAGRYRIMKRVGQGGLGVVYLAEHVLIQKQVAVKMLRHRPSVVDTRVEDLLNEARTAAKVRNDHIVDITDFGRAESGDVFLVMEYLEGKSLAQDVFERERLDVARTLRIVDQICTALAVAHAADVVHCDLKPENVFLVEKTRRSDFVKILDFGIAAIRELGEPSTETRAPAGTPEYMAPEQIRGAAPDPSFDVYAVGCILYELLTGAPPFVADTPKEVMLMHLREPVQAPSLRAPTAGIPADVDALVLRALAKDPGQRFATVRALGVALAACRDPASGTRLLRRHESYGAGGLTSPIVDAIAPPARRGGVLALAAVCALVAVVGAMWWRAGAPRRAARAALAAVRSRLATGELLEPRGDGALDRLQRARVVAADDPALPTLAVELGAALRAQAQRARPVDAARASELLSRAVELLPGDRAVAAELAAARRAVFAARAGMVAVGASYIDRYEYPNVAGATPLTRVDWGVAKDLCERAGKRLCDEAEWEAACAGERGRHFPYGGRYDRAVCDTQAEAELPHAAGLHARCVSPVGAFDLSGNVAEWTASRLSAGAPQMVVRGGSWGDGRDKVTCQSRDYFMPGLGGARHIGFRCCL